MQWMQKNVLEKLTKNEKLNFVSLKPEGVDSNLFTYHLSQLVKDGYVKKEGKEYSLTSEGKRHVGGLSFSAGGVVTSPRVFAMLFIEDEKGDYVLYKWNRQPYLNHVSLPFGRVRYGQPITQMAGENLGFKTGLAGKPKFRGEVSVIAMSKDEVCTHYLAHIFGVRVEKQSVEADGLTGQPFWGRIEDYKPNDTVYGTKEIIDIIKSKKSPFFEEVLLDKSTPG